MLILPFWVGCSIPIDTDLLDKQKQLIDRNTGDGMLNLLPFSRLWIIQRRADIYIQKTNLCNNASDRLISESP